MEFLKKGKFSIWLGVALLFATYFFFLAHPLNLVTADMGRHIRNGEQFASSFEVIKINFYSYTHADFPTTNHHWGAGAVFYLLWQGFGLVGPHLFFIALSLSALFVFWKIAIKQSSSGWILFAGVLTLPLLSERTEVRPEVVSYLFSGLFILFLLKFRSSEWSWKKLLLFVLPLQVLWVNSHIYFILGPAIAAAFLAEGLIIRNWERAKQLSVVIVSLFLVSLINPFGARGVLAPFTIFENFGYRLVENQSVWFLSRVHPVANLPIFEFVFALVVVSFILLAVRRRKRWDWAVFFLSLGFSLMGWLMLRNFTIFGLFALTVLSWNLKSAFPKPDLRKPALAVMALVFLLTVSGELARVYPYNPNFALGQLPGNDAAAKFIKDNGAAGPVFNNYDIGGYLIFHLYPNERVFVDNRPEAYPASFFADVYIPMQEDEAVWREQLEQYNFNMVVFSHRDFTPWGQKFLASRVDDPDWAPVFFDQYVIIFLRRNRQNQEIIRKFEIPRNNFGIASR